MRKFIDAFFISLGVIGACLIYMAILITVGDWLYNISFFLYMAWIIFMICALIAFLHATWPNDDETEQTKKHPKILKTKIKNIKKKSRLS